MLLVAMERSELQWLSRMEGGGLLPAVVVVVGALEGAASLVQGNAPERSREGWRGLIRSRGVDLLALKRLLEQGQEALLRRAPLPDAPS